MDFTSGHSYPGLSQAHTLIFNRTLSIASPFSLRCAVELGIADILHAHGRPMSLPDLAEEIPIPPEKTSVLRRLMRILVSHNVFDAQTDGENQNLTSYLLTPFSTLLLKNGTNMSAYVMALLDPVLVHPWYYMGEWFKTKGGSSPFEAAYEGKCMWEVTKERPELNTLFNEAMACDARWVMKAVVTECPYVFKGLKSLVDVGGGTGTAARAIAEAFPEVKCTVFDLPHVVATMPETAVVEVVAGSMFEFIPKADAAFLKNIFHDWNDKDCVKILKQCKKAIPPKEEGGKVIIVEVVVNSRSDDPNVTETHLFYDMTMMIGVGGKERQKHEWQKIFIEAGFRDYRIYPMLGIYSVIEFYP